MKCVEHNLENSNIIDKFT